jgi:hypothetical protein
MTAQPAPQPGPPVSGKLTRRPAGGWDPADFDAVPLRVLQRAVRARRLAARGRDVRANPRSATGRHKETRALVADLRDLLAAIPRRNLDLADLPALAQLAADADAVLGAAFWQLIRAGFDGPEVAAALGVRKQSAYQRFARYRPADMPVAAGLAARRRGKGVKQQCR